MSVIVVKGSDRNYIACDSLFGELSFKYISRCEENFSIFPLRGVKNVLVGHHGRDRECDLIKITNLIPEEIKDKPIGFEEVVKYIVPGMFNALEEAKYLSKDPYGQDRRMRSQWIIVTPEKIFVIDIDGSVSAFDEYAAIGELPAIMMGSLLSSKGKEPKKRILDAFTALAKNGVYASYPVIISDTKTCKFTVIEKNK